MTQPYYTATAGPADPNAGMRAKLYAGLGLLSGVVTFLQALNIVDSGQAAGIASVLTGITTLLGTFGFGLAASKTNKQVANGTFDPAPPPPAATPAQTAVEGIAAVANQFNDLTQAVAAGVQRVQDVAGGLTSALPNFGNLLGAPNSLAAQVAAMAASGAPGGLAAPAPAPYTGQTP